MSLTLLNLYLGALAGYLAMLPKMTTQLNDSRGQTKALSPPVGSSSENEIHGHHNSFTGCILFVIVHGE